MLEALVDAEATAHIGANPYEHTPSRTTQRNGTREKTVSTTAGDLMVKIPKLRAGSVFLRCSILKVLWTNHRVALNLLGFVSDLGLHPHTTDVLPGFFTVSGITHLFEVKSVLLPHFEHNSR